MAASGATPSIPLVTLNDGHVIPQLGPGVYEVSSSDTLKSVKWALEAGYRHIDTASVYGNEAEVGRAIGESDVPREDIFVTTKVWNTEMGYSSTIKACERSLKKLGMDYLDLYLIHSPVKSSRMESWRALVELQRQGKVRSIGVSNYAVQHLEEIVKGGSGVVPAVNQIEITPFNTRQDIENYCKDHGIVIQAYCPLTRSAKLSDPRLLHLQRTHHPTHTPAQLLIRWGVQRGFVSIPKSVNRGRIVENMDVFNWRLDEEHVREMDGWDEYLVTDWDPTVWK